jgi:hypothetical protein
MFAASLSVGMMMEIFAVVIFVLREIRNKLVLVVYTIKFH